MKTADENLAQSKARISTMIDRLKGFMHLGNQSPSYDKMKCAQSVFANGESSKQILNDLIRKTVDVKTKTSFFRQTEKKPASLNRIPIDTSKWADAHSIKIAYPREQSKLFAPKVNLGAFTMQQFEKGENLDVHNKDTFAFNLKKINLRKQDLDFKKPKNKFEDKNTIVHKIIILPKKLEYLVKENSRESKNSNATKSQKEQKKKEIKRSSSKNKTSSQIYTILVKDKTQNVNRENGLKKQRVSSKKLKKCVTEKFLKENINKYLC